MCQAWMSTLLSPQEREFRAPYLGQPNTRKRRRFLSHGSKPQAKHGKISQSGEIDAEWRKTLTLEEFRVTREQRAFSHRYYQEKRAGMYNCICYGAPLFSSQI
jgi:SelR domain